MLIRLLAVLSVLPWLWSSSQSGGAPAGPCAVRYIANAGVLFETGTSKFLIDAPIRESIPPYAAPDAEMRNRVETAQPPYDRVGAILVTHWHEDHFSAPAIASALRNSAGTVLLSSAEIVDRVRKADPSLAPDRFRPTTPAPGSSQRVEVSGVPIHVLRLRHSARRLPEQHVGFLIEGCRTVLHVGDADSDDENFAMLRTLPAVQVGVLPFWYVLEDRERQFVGRTIRPSRIIGMHLPPQDAKEVSAKVAGIPNLVLLTAAGSVHQVRDPSSVVRRPSSVVRRPSSGRRRTWAPGTCTWHFAPGTWHLHLALRTLAPGTLAPVRSPSIPHASSDAIDRDLQRGVDPLVGLRAHASE